MLLPKAKKSPAKPRKKRAPATGSRRIARIATAAALIAAAILSAAGNWYMHHPREWVEANSSILTAPLEYFGKRSAFITDALGWTGHDAVYESDDPIPTGSVCFAGAPRRIGEPAPADITILNRGEFTVGWSPSLRHPVWVAYHVPKLAKYPATKRPAFRRDRNVSSSPAAGDYYGSSYDRGHMAPNYAIVTRFGPEAQAKTFLMTNIAPQSPSLNRGPWRLLEKRIADFWTARYGEIWVIVGAVPPAASNRNTLVSGVAVPEQFYMLVAAQDADGVRALAFILPQEADRGSYVPHHIVTIAELEAITGLDFFPEMPGFLQRPLEADRPTRLWPVRLIDVAKLALAQFS